jgi:hypothetical protein
MLHESLEVKEFTAKEGEGFRLRIRSWEVTSPKGLYNLDFIQESLDEDGVVQDSSTYNFHLNKEEIESLCNGLLKNVA